MTGYSEACAAAVEVDPHDGVEGASGKGKSAKSCTHILSKSGHSLHN